MVLTKLSNYARIGLLSALLISFSACAGKDKLDKSSQSSSDTNVVDLTRPPVTIKETLSNEEESNPDETVSFEEWKKAQQKDE